MKTTRAASPRGRGRKGISTVVAIAIFFMIFAMAMTTVYAWQLMLADYSEVGIQQLSQDNMRVSERLEVDILNPYALLLTNPTSQTVKVLHVISDSQLIWQGSFDVGPFSSATLYHSQAGGETYRLATMRGNIFSAGLDEKSAVLAEEAWHVTFLMNDTHSWFSTPYAWGNSTAVGETYWYNANINWEWNYTSKAFGNMNVSSGACYGFVATATFVKVVNSSYNATINYYIDTGDSSNFDRSKVAFIIDGNQTKSRPIPSVVWYDASHYVWFTLEGEEFSTHTVSVYFYGRDVELQKLRLNVVNATFAP